MTDPIQQHGDLGANADAILAVIEAVEARISLPGLAIGIVTDGELSYFRGRGHANTDTRTPVTSDTIFRAGSITKTFTALTLLQLQEDGRLHLDQDANHHVTGFTVGDADNRWPAPTLRHLITHTAGVRWPTSRTPGSTVATALDALCTHPDEASPPIAQICAPHLPTHSPPGSRFEYSNYGAGILGHVIANATGQSYETRVAEHILQRLDMTNSQWSSSAFASDPPRATGYLQDGTPALEADWPLLIPSAGGLYSTSNDLTRYTSALTARGPQAATLPDSMRTDLFTPVVSGQLTKAIYSIGCTWKLCTIGDHRIAWHTGAWPGYSAALWIAYDAGIAVILLANKMSHEHNELLRMTLPIHILTLLLGEPRGTRVKPA